MKIKKRTIGIGAGVLAVSSLLGLIVTGYEIGWGPFGKLFKGFEEEVRAIEKRNDKNVRKKEILFYGASNFRLWKEMENDLKPYRVLNHGFGGCTDKDLLKYADRILYPYEPKIVFFQTGSNDYVKLPGTDEEKANACMAFKKSMFEKFHETLPDAKFVVMSGLLLPGRSEYTQLTMQINKRLKKLCEENNEYMYFADAQKMTFDGRSYREDLFVSDRIHLNHEGQLKWCEEYIRPMIEKLIKQEGYADLIEERSETA